MDEVELPTGDVIEERRDGERRTPGRRSDDVRKGRSATIQAIIWAVLGAVVVLYLFFLAVGAVTPDDAPAATIAVLVLAALWMAHSWRRLWGSGASPYGDRERRGF